MLSAYTPHVTSGITRLHALGMPYHTAMRCGGTHANVIVDSCASTDKNNDTKRKCDDGKYNVFHDIPLSRDVCHVRGIGFIVISGTSPPPTTDVLTYGERPRKVQVSPLSSLPPYRLHNASFGGFMLLSQLNASLAKCYNKVLC